MAITVKVYDGDILVDTLGKLELLAGKSLIHQHVLIEGIDSIPDNLPVDSSIDDVLEGFLSLRIKARLDALKDSLLLSDVTRSGEETIERIDIVLAKRVPWDPRTIKFWARVICGTGETQDVVG